MERRKFIQSSAATAVVVAIVGLICACSQKNKLKDEEETLHIAPPMNSLTLEEQNEGWKLLFDGKTLKGWRNYNREGISGWEVSDGCLVGLGLGGEAGGDIISVKQYGNFILKWEWKLGSGGNSGVIYKVQEGEQYHVPWETGPEYQLIDDENYEFELEEWQKTAADYAMYEPSSEKVVNPQEWNSSMIISNTENVEYWLNGKKVVQFVPLSEAWHNRRESGKFKDYPDYGSAPKGHIAVQDHGSRVWFRNMKIREYW